MNSIKVFELTMLIFIICLCIGFFISYYDNIEITNITFNVMNSINSNTTVVEINSIIDNACRQADFWVKPVSECRQNIQIDLMPKIINIRMLK